MVDQNINELIKSYLLQGLSREEIYKNLLEQGYSVSLIQDSFEYLNKVENSGDSEKKIINIVLLIAALLIGAGIFSFVASNWQYMNKPTKISLIIFFMVAAYFFWLGFKRKKRI